MEQLEQGRSGRILRVLALLVLTISFALVTVHSAHATTEPGSDQVQVEEEEAEGFTLMTRLKQVGIIAVIPVTLGALYYGAKKLRGEPVKKKRTSTKTAAATPRPKSRMTVAPPPSRHAKRSGMKQVRRLKRK